MTRLFWFFAILFTIHLSRSLIPGLLVRGFWDPEYQMKVDCLRARMNEFPGHPLWLVDGSSRVYFGLQPGLEADRLADKNAPLIFNFGMLGADLFRQLICLNRLIEEGIKPQRVCIEIHQIALAQQRSSFIEMTPLVPRARWNELATYYLYSPEPSRVLFWWLRSRFDPAFAIGVKVDHPPLFSKPPIPSDKWGWGGITVENWLPRQAADRANYPRLLESARQNYEEEFKQSFSISPSPDRALRQILDLCRKNGIDAVLFGMPEAKDFQAFYPAGSDAVISNYLGGIEKEYHVPMIDGRQWLPDAADFADGHHLNPPGSEKFTRRFIDELLKLPRAS